MEAPTPGVSSKSSEQHRKSRRLRTAPSLLRRNSFARDLAANIFSPYCGRTNHRMKLRALISDIYNTLLEVGPPPADAAERWEFLWEDMLADPARLTLEEFAAACENIIAREHDSAIQVGVQNPEIYWPAVAKEALPELARLAESARDEFMYQHAQLQRTVRLMPGAGEVLSKLQETTILLGLASNCQPYTLRE